MGPVCAAINPENGIDTKSKRKPDEVITQTAESAILALIDYAIKNNASDIHFQPIPKDGDRYTMMVRVRIDGILIRIGGEMVQNIAEKVIGYIRANSEMKIEEHRTPQDGRLVVKYYKEKVRYLNGTYIDRKDDVKMPDLKGKLINFSDDADDTEKPEVEDEVLNFDVRVNSVPVPLQTGFVQRIVLRILDSRRAKIALKDSGMMKVTEDKLRALINLGKGMVLCVGPTGSGKTSTLYALLNEINQPGINILTIEDPIEYRLNNVTQIQPSPKMDFAGAIRAFLRQDPDVIMVGEIRDSETVQVAIKAAMTGHMVLSTLHTNDAVTTVSRLGEMGVPEYLIADCLISVLSQRLVRCVCPKCTKVVSCSIFDLGEKFGISPDRINEISKIVGFELVEQVKIYQEGTSKVKCDECENKGYKGRLAVHELLEVTPKVAKMIRDNASTEDIQKEAQKAGMLTILEDAFIKVLMRKTTYEEVIRVLYL